MGKPAKRQVKKKSVDKLKEYKNDLAIKRAELWTTITCKEEAEAVMPQLEKLYGRNGLKQALEQRGFL